MKYFQEGNGKIIREYSSNFRKIFLRCTIWRNFKKGFREFQRKWRNYERNLKENFEEIQKTLRANFRNILMEILLNYRDSF